MKASGEEIVACYGELAGLVSRMLEVARGTDWGLLPALDTQCWAVVDRLKALEPHPRLEADQRACARALSARICEEQAEIASLVRPQLLVLQRRMRELQQARKLVSAYGMA